MPLATGDKLGPYQILSAIGAGGMGEVYKARDTRLDRTVAGYIELLLTKHSKPTVKQHLAAIRMLRLARHRPSHPAQPGALGARAQARCQERKDVGVVGRGDGHPAQVHFGSG